MSNKHKKVQRVSVAGDLTQNIERPRDQSVTTRIDKESHRFLEEMAFEAFKHNIQSKEGKKKNPSVSNELYRCVDIVKEVADHYNLKSSEDISETLKEMMAVYDALDMLQKGDVEEDQVFQQLKKIKGL